MAGRAENGGWRIPTIGRAAEAVEQLSDTDESDSDDATQSDEPNWVSWFCSLRGNEFFCEVDEDYIEDDFNLSGLSSQVPYYDYALDMVLDNEPPQDVLLTDQQHELLESAAEMLYGLIHARYIVTARGLASMLEKFKNCEFGRCPRVLCDGQACLPVGTSDVPGQSTVKIFCPRCEDIYYPRSEYQCSIDGAYFGTTFPHLLLMSYPGYRPPKSTDVYVPRVFGFKLHPSAYSGGSRDGGSAREQQAATASGTSRATTSQAVTAPARRMPVFGEKAATADSEQQAAGTGGNSSQAAGQKPDNSQDAL